MNSWQTVIATRNLIATRKTYCLEGAIATGVLLWVSVGALAQVPGRTVVPSEYLRPSNSVRPSSSVSRQPEALAGATDGPNQRFAQVPRTERVFGPSSEPLRGSKPAKQDSPGTTRTGDSVLVRKHSSLDGESTQLESSPRVSLGRAGAHEGELREKPAPDSDRGKLSNEPSAQENFDKASRWELPAEVVIEDSGGELGWKGTLSKTADTDAVWFEGEYLLWKRRGQRLPPLVTTDPNDGILPDATILFGGSHEGGLTRPGGRFRIGAWSDATQLLGWEAGLTAMGQAAVTFEADSDTYGLLARPFFNFTDDLQGGFVGQDSFLVADPGSATGRIQVVSSADLLAADVTCRRVFRLGGPWRIDLLAGYQMARIDSALQIHSQTELINSNVQIVVEDVFDTQNEFHGGSLGFELQRAWRGGNLELLARVGFGNMHQRVRIDGRQETTSGGQVSVIEGGLLAQSTNMGVHTRDVMAIAPQLGLRVRVPMGRHIQFLAGYSFLYWNRVALPADQIDPDLGVNPNQPPPSNEPQRPAFLFRDSDYYVHGAHLGLQWSF